MPQPISLDLKHHDEPLLDLTIPLKRKPPLLTLMAAAMVANACRLPPREYSLPSEDAVP